MRLFRFLKRKTTPKEPYKAKRVSVLDVGYGKGERLKYYVKRGKDRKLLGIDEAVRLESTNPNVEFRVGDFIREMEKVEGNSRDIVTADFLFEGMFDNHPRKNSLTFAEMNDIAWEKTPKFFDEAKRILTPNGRLSLTHYAGNIDSTKMHFERHGFKVVLARPIDPKKDFMTSWTKKAMVEARGHRDRVPWKIVAKKI
jgi:SAM-dependent methyltransferase